MPNLEKMSPNLEGEKKKKEVLTITDENLESQIDAAFGNLEDVKFEGKEGQKIDADPKNEESRAKIKGEARMKFEELSRSRGFGKEAQDKLYAEMTKMLKEVDNSENLSVELDKKVEAIKTSLEEAADQIEIDDAMNATANS